MKPNVLEYRPEIDGLRAIAVGAVVVYHAQIRIFEKLLLPGGFLGVDIFFVISGYLITYLIFKEKFSSNNFSFKNFYERRARRILPALLVMLMIMFPFAYIALIPSDFKEYALSNIFSIGFTSNYFFYFNETEYGSIDGLLKPLLHTWSLGVEEQFYIFFPIVMILFLNNNWSFRMFAILFILSSFFFASYLSITKEQLSFFSLPTRVWELFFGALTAYLIFFNKINFIKKYILNILSYIGIISIFLSFIFFQKNTYHPSYLTFFSVIGTCFIIINLKSDNVVHKILSSKMFVFVGLISYSLYLYHYPIFSLSRYYSLISGYNLYGKIALMFAVFLISYLSYALIEKPFRNKKKISFNKLLSFIFFAIFLIVSVSILILNNKIENKKYNIVKEFSLDNRIYNDEWSKYQSNGELDRNKKNILLIGNSHAKDSYIIFSKLFADNNNLNFIYFSAQVECLKDLSKNELCGEKINKSQIDLFEESDYLILSTLWYEKDLIHLEKIIKELDNKKNKIILMSSSPTFTWVNVFTLLDKFVLENKKFPSIKEIELLERELFNQIPKSIFINNEKLKEISKKNNLTYLDKFEYTCNLIKNRCRILTDQNKKIYYDNSHYTIDGSFYFVGLFKNLGWSKLFN